MGKNLNMSLNKPAEKVECQDPEHEGDRSINNDDWWMEWPDFVFRCDACHKKSNKLNNIAEKVDDTMSQEQLELLDRNVIEGR
jgi:hypothetical protein